jgi:hypothetical protein
VFLPIDINISTISAQTSTHSITTIQGITNRNTIIEMFPSSRYHSRIFHPSVEALIQMSQNKLIYLSESIASTNRDSPDFLRKGILIQNALDWGLIEREQERKRKTEESVFLRRSSKPSSRSLSSLWNGHAFERGMDALFEGDEQGAGGDDGVVIDPTPYIPEEEGQEAWFEETWNELHSSETGSSASSSPQTSPMVVDNMLPQDTRVEIYAVDDTDMSSSSRSTTPSPPPFETSLSFTPPPSPRLKATLVADKLEGPMDINTLPPSLESAMTVDEILEVYDIFDEEEEEIDLMVQLPTDRPELTHNSSYLSEFDDEVPDFESDTEDTESPDQLLATPTEDVLDDFSTSFDSTYDSLEESINMRMIASKKGEDIAYGRGVRIVKS